ncbi:nitrogen regulation protein NR(I) [Sphingobium yanoikuyae]|jgi:two-component system nitrogen regulation response regulator GlnG|uniref:DNA-binding transcriptional regulator NtrC n=1 Tax=Sphingobium yanoikuyae TaxID=13690 RepID=A0A085K9R5_SPHYA|nr:nitrogen regulation protein NR(I) [Sphingobium yanoikuyae]AYO77440.1 nitrogen regulation protein NR(I) [Sphingobium yanoikuyae]KFD29461.1 chemotaxis protein CheY [Sphingobium yanoikuyae]KZC80212.1 nitrogen regulation protein NR(I) [Sphingobium yanoikuyae]MDV3479202.1 nitrogen regulation protein NR(I) [Sphingobium yanoikuyae]
MAATGTVLVVDDDPAICVVVGEALRRQGHKVKIAGSIRERTALMESFSPDILITDVMLPDGDGLDGVAEIIERKPDLNVIILSAQNTLNTAIRATEKGAFEYLPKPFDLNELTRAVADALGHRSGSADATEQGLPHDGLPLVGRSPAMQEVYRTIARVLSNDLSILVLGESGTGKELVAEAIHSLGQRRTRPFVAINMAAIPRELIEAELFGYEKGAFTGAQTRTAGKFEQAQGGTLFLDEIGDMPMEAQTRLLRVLQSGEVTTVGGSKPVRVDVRIIAATNKDLPRLIEENRFRQDLYYRLNVVPVSLPPLRERREDVILLARHFLDRAAQDGLPRKALAEDAAQLLMAYHWPGNVRELQNIMQRLAVLSRENVIAADMLRHALPLDAVPADHAAPAGQLAQAVREWTKRQLGVGLGQANPQLHDNLLAVIEPILLQETLASVDGNQIRAAGLLGINRNTLRKKLTDYGLDPLQLRLSD